MTLAPSRTRNRRTSPIEFEKNAADRRQWPRYKRMTKDEDASLNRDVRGILRRDRDMGSAELSRKTGVDENRIKRLDAWLNRYQKGRPAKGSQTRDPFADKYADELTHGHEYEPAETVETHTWEAAGKTADQLQSAEDRGDGPTIKRPNNPDTYDKDRADGQIVRCHKQAVASSDDFLDHVIAVEKFDAARSAKESAQDEEHAAEMAKKKNMAVERRRKQELQKLVASQRKSARETDCPIDGDPWVEPRGADSILSRMLGRSKSAK